MVSLETPSPPPSTLVCSFWVSASCVLSPWGARKHKQKIRILLINSVRWVYSSMPFFFLFVSFPSCTWERKQVPRLALRELKSFQNSAWERAKANYENPCDCYLCVAREGKFISRYGYHIYNSLKFMISFASGKLITTTIETWPRFHKILSTPGINMFS